MDNIQQSNYHEFLIEVKERIYRSQYEALKHVNKELLNLYWWLGQAIVEKQEQYGWGKSVIENLSKDLQNDFPGVQGFSVQNLWNMRKMYLEYKNNEKLQPLVGEISWTKNIIIISKCKNDLEREFYIKMTKKYGWTKNVLINQIEGGSYERFLSNQTNFDKALEEKYKHQAKLAVKDNYTFDFLELAEEYSEREMELALIRNIRKFLLEMGGNYSFIGNQYHLQVGKEDYSVDLLLYHRRLRCLVAIDLKTGKFKPEYAGKMQFYLTSLNEQVKYEDENPSIGIIICKSKDRTVVEYALKQTTAPIGIAAYTLEKTLPEELKKYLPSPEEIAERLKFFEE